MTYEQFVARLRHISPGTLELIEQELGVSIAQLLAQRAIASGKTSKFKSLLLSWEKSGAFRAWPSNRRNVNTSFTMGTGEAGRRVAALPALRIATKSLRARLAQQGHVKSSFHADFAPTTTKRSPFDLADEREKYPKFYRPIIRKAMRRVRPGRRPGGDLKGGGGPLAADIEVEIGALLQEIGDFLLLETGDKILLE